MKALACLVILLAGCAAVPGPITDSTPTPAASPWTCVAPEKAIQFGDGHDHNDPAQHRFACNATLVGHDDLRRFGWTQNTVVGAHAADIAANRGLLAVGVNAGETDGGQQGFHLFRIAPDGNLTHLAYYDSADPVGGDRTIAFSDDGETVYLGYEGGNRPGIAAIDVRDELHPRERARYDDPAGYGAHTVAAGTINGDRYAFVLSVGVTILSDDGDHFTLVGKYVTADQLAILDAPNSGSGAETYAFRSLYGHDMTLFADPGEGGRTLLMVAYAYDGFKILDVSQPSLPVLIGRWLPPADTTHKHYTHSVEAERLTDGTLLVVVGSETFEPENQGIASPLWVLDATATVGSATAAVAPTLGPDPVLLGTWRNPAKAPAGNLGLSVHFFRLENGTLYASHYHGGVWAIQLATAAQRTDPKAFGYAMPVLPDSVRPPQDCCIGFDLDGAPMVFDVAVLNGVAYAADEAQGVIAIRFTPPVAA